MRTTSFRPVLVLCVRLVNDNQGNPVVIFNMFTEPIEISLDELKDCGCYNPYSLVGNHIMVETDENGKLKRTEDGFPYLMVEINKEVANALELELVRKQYNSWTTKVINNQENQVDKRFTRLD